MDDRSHRPLLDDIIASVADSNLCMLLVFLFKFSIVYTPFAYILKRLFMQIGLFLKFSIYPHHNFTKSMRTSLYNTHTNVSIKHIKINTENLACQHMKWLYFVYNLFQLRFAKWLTLQKHWITSFCCCLSEVTLICSI